MALYIGLDPSYKEYGVSYIDTDECKIVLDSFGVEINQKENKTVLDAIPVIVDLLERRLLSPIALNYNKTVMVGIELDTAVTARNQAICYALDYATYNKFKDYTDKLNLYTTNYIRYVQKFRYDDALNIDKWLDQKLYTIYLVEFLLSKFEQEGYTIEKKVIEKNICGPKSGNRYPKKDTISSGEADSFIFALRQFIKDGNILRRFRIDEYIERIVEDKELS